MGAKNELLDIVKNFPMLYVFATASRSYPNALVTDVLSELESGKEGVFEKYDLITLHKSGAKTPIKYTEDYLRGAKGNFTCICPFHADSSEGSLIVTSQFSNKNMFKCFACGAGGDVVNFEQQYFGLSFKDALYHLAFRLGLIDETSMKQKFASQNTIVKAVEKQTVVTKEIVDEIIADKDVISNVYKAMVKRYGLTKAHQKHLAQKRNLHEEDFAGYFSFPDRSTDIAEEIKMTIARSMAEKFFNKSSDQINRLDAETMMASPSFKKLEEQFKYVPGFYLNKSTGKIEWMYKQGIGLLAMDEDGFVRGVQVQNLDPTSTAAKYVWWSSRAKLGEDGFEGGSSPGSPGGVIYPKDPYHLREGDDINTAPIVITEGKYKAEALAQQGNIAIYVSGVGTWRNIIPTIEKIRGDRTKIYVAFDADAMGKISVFNPLNAICEELKSMDLKPIILVWSSSVGKGFDDLIHEQGFIYYKEYLKAVQFEEFSKIFNGTMENLLAQMGVSTISSFASNKTLNKKFTSLLQTKVEEALNLKQYKI